jgi:hypothetical protein
MTVFQAQGLQALAVTHTWEMHEKIADLLAKLHDARPRPLTKDEINKLPAPPGEQ